MIGLCYKTVVKKFQAAQRGVNAFVRVTWKRRWVGLAVRKEGDQETADEKISAICWFTPQMATVARAGPESGVSFRFEYKSPSTKLGLYEMLAASLAMPQCQPHVNTRAWFKFRAKFTPNYQRASDKR